MENAGKGEVRGSVPARRTRDHQNMRSTARASLFMIMCPQSRSAALAGKGMAFAAAKKAFSSVGRNGGGVSGDRSVSRARKVQTLNVQHLRLPESIRDISPRAACESMRSSSLRIALQNRMTALFQKGNRGGWKLWRAPEVGEWV